MATETRFEIALRVADLGRAVAFYRLLLSCAPCQQTATSARFEPERLALALTLKHGAERNPDGTLNHVGLRLPDQLALVDLQRRFEEAGIATQRQEGVECCYALQTKFWATDPDKHLWELYIFHEDLDHSGFDDPSHLPSSKPQAEPKFWTHALTDPIPARLDFGDGSLDEVNLEGTFNALLDEIVQTNFLAEILRVLRPGGKLAIHGMASDRPFPGTPMFPGIAALVKHVPSQAELTETLHWAGFIDLLLEKFDSICFSVPGVELREIRLIGVRPEKAAFSGSRQVINRGPFEEVMGDDGIVFRRGERTTIDAAGWMNLRGSLVADQFVFFSKPESYASIGEKKP